MKIALDAMGTDNCPGPEVEGTVAAFPELPKDVSILLVGDETKIKPLLAKIPGAGSLPLSIHHTSVAVTMDESPAKALKSKPDSSMAITVGLQKKGVVQASISAGNTGAFMGSALFILGRIEKVNKPGICIAWPTPHGKPVAVIDCGAVADCKPVNLVQFGLMGSIFAHKALGIENPRVGLMNVGEESTKGNELASQTYPLLAAASAINFIGNLEGHDIMLNKADVIVCDGFVGNILLKFFESVPHLVKKLVGDTFKQDSFAPFRQAFNRDIYGGGDLLGVEGVVTICHGSSTGLAIKQAILKTYRMAQEKINDEIRRQICLLKETP
jgi:phosphate acyltransferase